MGTAVQPLPGSGMGRAPRAWPFHSNFGFKGISCSHLRVKFGNAGRSWDAPACVGRSCQDLPALEDAASRLEQLSPELCLHEALLSPGSLPSGRNSAFPTKIHPVGAGI